MSDTSPILEIKNLTKIFHVGGRDVTAVDNISFDLHAGQVLGIIGESGSGKSTTARLILGLEAPTSGEIKYLGKDVTKMSRAERQDMRKGVQVVFQEPFQSLNPKMKIESIIGEPLLVAGEKSRDARRARVLETLAMVGLDAKLAERFPAELSGGQQQRIGIARAIVGNPKVLILDEPTASLDRTVRKHVSLVLAELQRDLNLAYILITHDMGTVRRSTDTALVMLNGRIIEHGTTKQIMTDPKEDYSRRLIGAELPAVPPVKSSGVNN